MKTMSFPTKMEKMDAMVGKSTMGTVTHLVGTLRIMPIMAGIMAGSMVGIILVGIPVGIPVGILVGI